MKALVILNGGKINISGLEELISESDTIICADGGAKWAYEAGIKADVIIGDMDSVDEDILKNAVQTGAQAIKMPAEKDETDGVLAVDYALSKGADEVNILGAAGGRLDHQYGNIMLLKRLQAAGCKGKIILDGGYVIMSDGAVEISCRPGDVISIIPFEGKLVIKESDGLKYKIDSRTIFDYGYPVGVSNQATADTVKLYIVSGNALIFYYTN